LGYEPNLQEIQDKECPQCPYGPNSSKTNRENLKLSNTYHGNFTV
jgi:hypothetical protein